MNQIVLVGRIVNGLELNETEDGQKFTKITLAVTRPFKNSEGVYENDYISCNLWNTMALNSCEYCKKGDIVGVKGRLQTRSYEDEEKNKKYVTEVVAEKITFLSAKKDYDNDSSKDKSDEEIEV